MEEIMAASRESYLTVMEYRKRIESDTWSFFRNDPELARARPVPHPRKSNKIIFFSGAMAGFFPLVASRGKIGVKLFFQKIPDLAVRYEAIGATLKQIASPHFIALEYREGRQGGAVWGSEYTPYVKMECVEGVVLKERVIDLSATGDTWGLRGLAEQWRQIAMMMEREKIAHGDIQAENLMVEPSGRIRLIDLDTMFVPGLRPRRLKCVAYGIPAWQHPRKLTDESHFDERLDRFPALAMYLCLLALSENPSLFNPHAVGENEILFTKQDFLDPSASEIFQSLGRSRDAEVRRLAEALAKAAVAPYDQVPIFSKLADPDAEAREALAAFESLLRTDDDDLIAKAWPALAQFAPAQRHHARAEEAVDRMTTLAEFIAQVRKEPNNDSDLWSIWTRHPGMDRCKPASCPLPQFGGLVPAQRAALARKRIEALNEFKSVIEARGHPPLDESGEREILGAWRQREAMLGASNSAVPLRKRSEEAQKRLRAWDLLQKGLAEEDDESIAAGWQSGLMTDFAPAQALALRCRESAERIQVVTALNQRHKEDPEDEAGFLRIASARPDLAKCRAFLRPNPALNGRNWQERLGAAAKVLDLRATLTQLLARDPPSYDQAAEAWNETLCHRHSLFAPDLARIQEVLGLARLLKALREGLGREDLVLTSASWRDEFRSLVTDEELARVKRAMQARFTGPNCLEHPEIGLEGQTLTVRWDWRGSGGFCFVAAAEGGYPALPAAARPNAFQGGATGGLCTLPFSGNSPHVRLWAMFRFLDQFLLGQEPIEKRLATVEYAVSRRLLRNHQLSLRSLSGPMNLPALALFVSENPMWPDAQAVQTLSPQRLEQTAAVDLVLPATVSRDKALYLRLRPVDLTQENWLRLRPRAAEAVRIRL